MTELKICKRCNQPVTLNADSYDLFEKMHWLCFHLEFEHEGDPDMACNDPGCPWWQIDVFKGKLNQLGVDPEALIKDDIEKKWNP